MSAYGASFQIFEELDRLLSRSYRVVLPIQVHEELKEISKGKGKPAAAARLGLNLISDLDTMETGGEYADKAILKLVDSLEGKVIVCTNDRALKNILKAGGVKVVGVRSNSRLDFL